MECMWCKGRMSLGTAPFSADRKGYHLQLEAVAAWVCSQCGEPYFEEAEVARIQAILQAVDERVADRASQLEIG
ncbi:MAG: type II toxin-antitoxin system MqsA family antitoxin [Candidatus Riflebacteria bacterium]|nr:type II toxin-antitoxin system MqsA family antitoxin [Candidatus Riflebacteria bacterium]